MYMSMHVAPHFDGGNAEVEVKQCEDYQRITIKSRQRDYNDVSLSFDTKVELTAFINLLKEKLDSGNCDCYDCKKKREEAQDKAIAEYQESLFEGCPTLVDGELK